MKTLNIWHMHILVSDLYKMIKTYKKLIKFPIHCIHDAVDNFPQKDIMKLDYCLLI